MKLKKGEIKNSHAQMILYLGCSEVDKETGIAKVENGLDHLIPGIGAFFGGVLIEWWHQQPGNEGAPLHLFPENLIYGILLAIRPVDETKPTVGFFQNRQRFHDVPNDTIVEISLSALMRYLINFPETTVAIQHPRPGSSKTSTAINLMPDTVEFWI